MAAVVEKIAGWFAEKLDLESVAESAVVVMAAEHQIAGTVCPYLGIG